MKKVIVIVAYWLAAIFLTASDVITIAGQSIPVSRKYKDAVKSNF